MSSMKAKLISLNASGTRAVVALEKLPVVLGRGAQADVRLPDQTLSRRHCEIDCVSATLVVRDLGSKNGTRVNRQHVTESVLMPGDKLTLGSSTFVVSYEQRPGAVERPGRVGLGLGELEEDTTLSADPMSSRL
jgi:pSer/pThr/pTyr-binding forkhead associated (FHA) protein